MIKRTKLKDIADALNISVTTVSRAINSKTDISDETKKAVLDMAEELNYRPNALAVSLRKSEFNVIGVILPSVDHYFFGTVLKGIMNKAHQSNYLVMIGESMNDVEKEKEILNQFMSHCVTGILISPSVQDNTHDSLSQVRNKRIPFVVVDRPSKNEIDSVVKYDDHNGAYIAVEHLIHQGCNKIAMLKGRDDCIISQIRLEGYKRALIDNGLRYDSNLVKCGPEPSKKIGYMLSKDIILSNKGVDGFFCITDELASGVYEAAHEYNLRIPEDISIVGYSNSELSTHLSPKLSSVEQPGEKMGELAFDYLQQIIIGNNRLIKKTFDARLIIRNSSAKNIPVTVS